MNWKTWAPLGVALVLGLIAAKVAITVIGKNHGAGSSDTVPVVVALKDIDAGAVLTAADLKVARIERVNAPAAAFADINVLEGRTLTTSLSENVPLVPTMLADAGTGSGLQALLPPGMRAMTVDVGEVKGSSDFITPRSKVDVVTTVTEDGQSKPVARTLLEDVTVMAVGTRMNANTPSGPEPARTITLLLTPEQAELLELATTTTKVRLMIRNGHDASKIASEGTTVAELRGSTTRPTGDMVVAKRTLEAGELLSEDDLTISAVAPEEKPLASFDKTFPLVGRVLSERVTANFPLLSSTLAPEGTPPGIAGLLPSGMRAMTIDVEELKGATDFIQPKTHIDLVTTRTEEGQTKPVAVTLLENIQVLATGTKTIITEKMGPQQAKTITLLLTPEQAETLELATSTTKVRMMLRNSHDASRAAAGSTAGLTSPTTVPTAEAAVSVRPRTRTVQVIKGGVETKVTFEIKEPAKAKPAEPQASPTVVSNGG